MLIRAASPLFALSLALPAQEPAALPRIDGLPPLTLAQGASEPRVEGWSFESIGYAKDVGRKRVIRIGPEGESELRAPEQGLGVLLRGRSDTARGDLVSAPFALEPFRWVRVELRYRITSGKPLVFLGLRPAENRALVDLEFVTGRRSRSPRRVGIDLHSGSHEGPYALALSIGGTGTVQLLSVTAEERGDYARPERPLCVLDIRSANPDLKPNSNFARVASVFGFPSVEYLHYKEFSVEKLDEIDPALLVLPGLASSKGMNSRLIDRVVLAAVVRDTPVIGVCLGHQVLARAHGAKLGRASEWGPTRIETVRRDPIFEGLPRSPFFFSSESHNFAVVDPIGKMQTIASSESCETQVFRYRGKPWYTFQSHIERGWEVASPEAVLLWKNMLRRWRLIQGPQAAPK